MTHFSFLIALMLPLAALARIPDEFRIVERFLSLAPTFDVESDIGRVAVVKKRLFSITPIYDLEDREGLRLGTAKVRLFAWGTVVDVTDAEGEAMGTIEEVIYRVIPWAQYKIFDKEDRLTASAKMDHWGTQFDLFSPENENQIFAIIERPHIRFFRDHWTVKIQENLIFDKGIIDPRLLIFLAALQTDKDSRYRKRTEISSGIEREWENLPK